MDNVAILRWTRVCLYGHLQSYLCGESIRHTSFSAFVEMGDDGILCSMHHTAMLHCCGNKNTANYQFNGGTEPWNWL